MGAPIKYALALRFLGKLSCSVNKMQMDEGIGKVQGDNGDEHISHH
jgi:hypothetical protein